MNRASRLVSHLSISHSASPSHPCGASAEPLILAEQKGRVGIITLNRPHALNALSFELMTALGQVIRTFEEKGSER